MIELTHTTHYIIDRISTVDNARIENNSVIFPSHSNANAEDVFPLDLLERLNELGRSFYRISDALHFYNVVRDAPEWYWSTPEELDGVDLTGWEIHYYESNWEDSCWNVVWTVAHVAKSNPEHDDGHYNAFDLQGEANLWSFYARQSLLLVKLTDDVFRGRREESEKEAAEAAAEEAAWEAAEAEREELDRQNETVVWVEADAQLNASVDPLKAWEDELLGLTTEDNKVDADEKEEL